MTCRPTGCTAVSPLSRVGIQYPVLSPGVMQEVPPACSEDSVEFAFVELLPMNVCECEAPGRPGNTIGSSGRLLRLTEQFIWNSWWVVGGLVFGGVAVDGTTPVTGGLAEHVAGATGGRRGGAGAEDLELVQRVAVAGAAGGAVHPDVPARAVDGQRLVAAGGVGGAVDAGPVVAVRGRLDLEGPGVRGLPLQLDLGDGGGGAEVDAQPLRVAPGTAPAGVGSAVERRLRPVRRRSPARRPAPACPARAGCPRRARSARPRPAAIRPGRRSRRWRAAVFFSFSSDLHWG